MLYQFTAKCKNLSADNIWAYIQNGLSKDVIIKSIKYKIPYNINYIKSDCISFSANSRNEKKPELIEKESFVKVVTLLLLEKEFNTSSSKQLFIGTKMYKQRSPLFALLLSSDVIEKQ